MEAARSRALKKRKKEAQQDSILNHLPSALRKEVISFLPGGDEKPKKFKKAAYSLPSYNTLFFDIKVFSVINDATKATHNLLNRIKVEETLSFIKENPHILFIPVKVKDFHGQWFSGKLVQVLASAGEFNPVEIKAEAKPYGLVHILQAYFTNPADFTNQLAERFKPGHELATQRRMAHIETAIKTFIEDTIESKEISENVPFETLLHLPIAEKFRKSIQPDPNDVVLVGLAWDMGIFITFIDLFNSKLKDLCGSKSDFVNAVVWPALQRRSPLADLEVLAIGIAYVVEEKEIAQSDRFDFSEGSARLDGIGTTHFFGFYGGVRDRVAVVPRGAARLGLDEPFRILGQTKTSALHSLCGQEATPRVTA